MLQRSPSPAARQRRYRKRQRNGDIMVTRAFTQAETAKLCRRGYLGP
jgi:hypothetical protein